MKKIIFIFFLCFIVWGCKKNPLDYRTKFLGEYDFEVFRTSWTIAPTFYDTTYSVLGEVRKNSEDGIQIILFDVMDFETSVYEDGSLIGCECSYQTHLNGEFESTKKLKFVLSNHGLGGGNTYHVTGNKK